MDTRNFFSDLWHATTPGRAIDRSRQERVVDARNNAAYDAYVAERGPGAGRPDDYLAFEQNDRTQQTQDLAVDQNMRSRQTEAQRSGLAIAREILSIEDPDQQVAAMQQYAPILGRAFGTDPAEIISSFDVIRNSADPQAQLNALDQALAGPDERERRMAEESDLEQAAIRANATTNAARIRADASGDDDTDAATTLARNEHRDQQATVVLDTIDEALDLAQNGGGILGTTGIGGLTQHFPGTESRELANKIRTIQANLGFDRLQQMREESPTGGALGQVAVREIEFLQATIATLDQLADEGAVVDALTRIRASYARLQDAIRQGRAQGAAPAAPGGNTSDPLASFLGR